MLKKSVCFFMIPLLILSSTGCSAFRSSTQTVSVNTDQPDTEIYINGFLAGRGTASTPVKRNQNVSVMAKKEGYITVQRTIGKSLNNTGILDIIGGVLILLPLFGLLSPGAYSLDEENINVAMIRA